jgi:inward rectifier potassium channel
MNFRKKSTPDDLGLGTVAANQSSLRLLNSDGSFNIIRRGYGRLGVANPYFRLLSVNWRVLFITICSSYLIINCFFALLYFECGPNALKTTVEGMHSLSLLSLFFFSVHTFATIGYGSVVPISTSANLLVTIESLVGLLWVALTTGIVFARFSRPVANIAFSEKILISPYGDISGLMFRIANRRINQLVEVRAQVSIALFENNNGLRQRKFYPLNLERDKIALFPLSWTVVHPIDAQSPLFGKTFEELQAADPEVLVLITGTDEAFSQAVHARSSFLKDKFVWGAKFIPFFDPPNVGDPIEFDLTRLGKYANAGLPEYQTGRLDGLPL